MSETHPSDEDERLQPLEERLRRLEWPQPPPGLRERSLEEFRRRLAEEQAAASQNGNGATAEEAEEASEEARRAP